MTNKDAAFEINLWKENLLRAKEPIFEEAFDMAISALQAVQPEPCEDCISRQAAIDALCNQCTLESKETCSTRLKGDNWCDEVYVLLNLPSAQPEIIRCKDCKYYKITDNRAFGFPVKRCKWTGFEDVDDDDFCSRAERRTDE